MPLEVKPLDRTSFEARLLCDRLGAVGIVRTMSSAATIEHTEQHVQQTATRLAFLVMPLEGCVELSCYGREATLEEGDVGLTDSFAVSRAVLRSTNQALLLAIPYHYLAAHAPNVQEFFGARLSGRCGLGHTVSVFVRSLCAQLEQGLPSQYGQQIAESLLALIAAAYAIEQGNEISESSLAAARRAQIKRYIESHLRDSDLNAVTIAKALALSPRYVRMVFAAENEHISAYVLRRRLEECAKRLGRTSWLGRSITETAFDWGFTSTAYFTRAFKQQFGVTPTVYRFERAPATRHEVVAE